jgi:hypothetical protein
MSSNYVTEGCRLASFHSWPRVASATVTPQKLARAGFYHDPTAEHPDRCTCFSCAASLVSWEPTDDPLEEHKKHSKHCDFLRHLSTVDASVGSIAAKNLLDLFVSRDGINHADKRGGKPGCKPSLLSEALRPFPTRTAQSPSVVCSLTLLRCSVIREILFSELLEQQKDENEWKCSDIPLS